MDSREYLVSSSKIMGTTAPETQWSRQIFIPVLKQEINDDNTPGSDYNMYPSEPLQLSQHFNYYDNKSYVFEQVKEELPRGEHSQSDCSVNSKTVPENNGFVTVIDKQKVKKENTESSSLHIKQENDDKQYEFNCKEFCGNDHQQYNSANSKTLSENNGLVNVIDKQKVKIENTEDYEDDEDVLSSNIKRENDDTVYEFTIKLEKIDENQEPEDVVEDTASIHYDVLVAPRQEQCKLCHRTFKNRFTLIKHNNKHIKIKINAPVYDVRKKIYRCQYCGERFTNRNKKHEHVNDAHKQERLKCKICGKQLKTVQGLNSHVKKLHKLKYPNGLTLFNVKCKYCDMDFKNKYYFNNHMKLCHPDKANEEVKFKCDSCGIVYKSKESLIDHTLRVHYDNADIFKSADGTEIQTPILLVDRVRQNDNGDNGKVECDYCHRIFKHRTNLRRHIRRSHYDYGKVFKCWCGKEYRSPYQLYGHKNIHNYSDSRVQCETCKRFFGSGIGLMKHRRKFHDDYGRMYECWCGEQLRTPSQLADHKREKHNKEAKGAGSDKVQCDTCKKMFHAKNALLRHIMRVHYDYGDEVFRCWCGKAFRSPYHLTDHKSNCDDGGTNGIPTTKVQCDICQKVFTKNRYLEKHRKRMHCYYRMLV